MVFAPVLGRVSDRVGRKPVIIFSLVGTAIGCFVTGAAGALWVLFLGRIIDGASGASVAVAQGAIADIAPPERRAQLLGMLGAAFGVGFVVGPALGGLAALGGPHVPFYVAGTIAAVNAVAAVIRLPETRPEAREERPARGSRAALTPDLRRYAAVGLLSTLGFAGFEATFSLWGAETFSLTEGSTALVFLFVGVLLVLVQGVFIGRLTASFGSRRLLRAGLAVVAAGMFTLASTSTWPVLFVALTFIAFGQGVAVPSGTALVTEAAPVERRGEALGYQQSVTALGRVAGPVIAGLLFDQVAVDAPFVVAGVFAGLALLAVWTVTRPERATNPQIPGTV
jgi:MFS family permease